MQEIVDAGHSFFGSASGGLAKVVESAFQKYGLPNGYILGQEGGGAFIAGLTYGEGQLNTKNAGEHNLYWQGPSLGLDYGGQGSRVMMLVYDLPSVNGIYARFGGVSGSAYVIAGFGMLAKAMSVLNERERRIFEARRLAEDPVTLEDLSTEFDISRERVRQIEVRAFEKVQDAVRKEAQERAKAVRVVEATA